MNKKAFLLPVMLLLVATSGRAQDGASHQHDHQTAQEGHSSACEQPPSQMPGMKDSPPPEGKPSFIREILEHTTSGTSAQPNSVQHPMFMFDAGKWMLMFHGEAFLNVEQQSGPRGDDKVFSTNWFMPMAQRRLGQGQLTLRGMFSLEPATVTDRVYPELFQQGETAFGRPISDGQHPHDFLMELAALYDWKIGEHALLSFYGAPVGDPAMGPPAYAHRASASEDPIAPLGHHLQDSTHIAYEVVTTGLAYKSVRVEASGFHGREPDEFRWGLNSGTMDSWSTRLTIQPGQNWSGQYSFAYLTSPEALHPGEDVQRMTASLMYNRALKSGNWATTLLWGRNHVLPGGENFNSYLVESTLRFRSERVWGRLESVDRTSELLLGKQPEPAGFEEHFLVRVQAYTAGYDHDFHFLPGLATAFGAQVTFYGTPAFLTPLYGRHPIGAIWFVRLRPTGNTHSQH
jgi:hypothetical protein